MATIKINFFIIKFCISVFRFRSLLNIEKSNFGSHLYFRWSKISKDPYAKTEWLIEHYKKVYTMFHAVRLGSSFIDIPMCQNLFAKNVIILKYFIQRLLMHFGRYDRKLIKLQIENNMKQFNTRIF